MIDPMGPVALRFPLIARPRPVCTPLPQRVADLRQRAKKASETGDLAAASAVFNLAALLASDCGLPDLARFWCLRLAHLTLTTRPTTTDDATCGLEPIINLARLHTRAGEGQAAWTLLEDLHQAIDARRTSRRRMSTLFDPSPPPCSMPRRPTDMPLGRPSRTRAADR